MARIEDHVDGFRRSPADERWRDLPHRFSEPFPQMEHCAAVRQAGDPPASRLLPLADDCRGGDRATHDAAGGNAAQPPALT